MKVFQRLFLCWLSDCGYFNKWNQRLSFSYLLTTPPWVPRFLVGRFLCVGVIVLSGCSVLFYKDSWLAPCVEKTFSPQETRMANGYLDGGNVGFSQLSLGSGCFTASGPSRETLSSWDFSRVSQIFFHRFLKLQRHVSNSLSKTTLNWLSEMSGRQALRTAMGGTKGKPIHLQHISPENVCLPILHTNLSPRHPLRRGLS